MKVERLALFHAVFVLLLNGKNHPSGSHGKSASEFLGDEGATKTIQTLPEANSEGKPLKIEGWKMNFVCWKLYFSGTMLNFQGVHKPHNIVGGWRIHNSSSSSHVLVQVIIFVQPLPPNL